MEYLAGAFAGVRIGAVRAARFDRELQPQEPFLAEAQGVRTGRLAVQAAIAVHFGVMLHQVARAVRPEGLLVRHAGQRQLALELVLDAVEVAVGEDRGGRPALHVGRAAAVDVAVGDLSRPGAVLPARLVGHRKHVDMAVQHQVLPGLRRIEACHDVRHDLVRGDHAVLQLLAVEESADVGHGFQRIARWVGRLGADEVAEKADQLVLVLVDPGEQLILHEPVPPSACRKAIRPMRHGFDLRNRDAAAQHR